MKNKSYNKAIKELNCRYADKNGICSVLSCEEIKEYCPLGPCKDYKQKHSKRIQRKIDKICELAQEYYKEFATHTGGSNGLRIE